MPMCVPIFSPFKSRQNMRRIFLNSLEYNILTLFEKPYTFCNQYIGSRGTRRASLQNIHKKSVDLKWLRNIR